MIATVTTSTVTTITTIAAVGFSVIIGTGALILLILFLGTREMAAAVNSSFSYRIARYLGVGILPLLIVFAVIVAIKAIEALV